MKPFLMGDQPLEEDCAVFAVLGQVYWHQPGPLEQLLKGTGLPLGQVKHILETGEHIYVALLFLSKLVTQARQLTH